MTRPKVEIPEDLEDGSVMMPGMSMEHLTALAIAEELEKLLPPTSSPHEQTLQPVPIPPEFLKNFANT